MSDISNVFVLSILFFLMLCSFMQEFYILIDQLSILIINLSDNSKTLEILIYLFFYIYSTKV